MCFQGEIADLKLVGNHLAAERLCDNEDDSDAVSLRFIKPFDLRCLNALVCETSFLSLRLAGLWRLERQRGRRRDTRGDRREGWSSRSI